MSHLGIAHTYEIVGCAIGCVALLNALFLKETKPNPLAVVPAVAAIAPSTMSTSSDPKPSAVASVASTKSGFDLTGTLSQWKVLMSQAEIRQLVLNNCFYWTGTIIFVVLATGVVSYFGFICCE